MSQNTEFETILQAGSEIRAREFKRSLSWDDPATQCKVVKFALGAANLQDGASLSFGLEQDGPLHKPTGMSREHYESFNQDRVAEKINTHATPHVDLSVNHIEMGGRLFVLIMVRQFVDYPVVCAKDFVNEKGKAEVIRGRIYCRSRRKPETTEVQTPEDMRDIIDLASNRNLERYLRQRETERKIVGSVPGDASSDADQFAAQAREVLG